MFNKIICFLVGHKWKASAKDYWDEFGGIPLDDRIASKSICNRCGKKYKDNQ